LVRKTGQIVGRGRRRWLVRVFLGRDHETRRRRYLSRTVHGPVRQAQSYLNKVLRERDLGRRVEGVAVTLDEFLDRWLDTAAKPKLREKSYHSYKVLWTVPTCFSTLAIKPPNFSNSTFVAASNFHTSLPFFCIASVRKPICKLVSKAANVVGPARQT
jgi:hypothetical protein